MSFRARQSSRRIRGRASMMRQEDIYYPPEEEEEEEEIAIENGSMSTSRRINILNRRKSRVSGSISVPSVIDVPPLRNAQVKWNDIATKVRTKIVTIFPSVPIKPEPIGIFDPEVTPTVRIKSNPISL